MASYQTIIGIVLSVFIGIVIIILIGLMIKTYYSPIRIGTVLIDKPVAMTDNMSTCAGKLLTSGSEHTYSFWFFIKQWETGGNNKRLFTRSHLLNYQLHVEMQSSYPNLVVSILDNDGLVQTHQGISDDSGDGYYRLQNVSIQGWNHVTMTIFDKTLDMYLNGKLVKSFILPVNLQSSEDNGISVGGSEADEVPTIDGFMARFIYYPRVLSPREIYRNYLKGPAAYGVLSSQPDYELGSEFVFGGKNTPDCSTAST